MSIINFSKANCKNCYRCVRECPVKAIRVKDEQAEIVEELCIACGNCLRVCPQNAKEVKSELDIIKGWISKGEKIAVSLAPSFSAVFKGKEWNSIVAGLKKLGISYVEETSEAARVISSGYQKYYNDSAKMLNITTCCPSVNYMIQKYYPSLIKYMIQMVSPVS